MPNLFNPDYLQHLAAKYDLRPSKKYGQNYLLDEEVIKQIISLANLSKGETVVEVGPGFGVLTLPLAEAAAQVFSFEIEKKLQPYWSEKLKELKNVEIVWGNILKQFPISNFQFPKYKVVANLPYQISSPAIRLFLETANPPELMVLMVQKEVGERICAAPGQMSLLSVAVQYYGEPKLEFVVPRSAFWPSPRVDSAVITIKTKIQEARSNTGDEWFFQIVKIGFANRRKLLLKNLEPVVGKKNKEKLKEIFTSLNLLHTVRAQELSVEQWRELVSLLKLV